MNEKTMKAMVLTGHGDIDKLVYRTDFPKPHAKDDEVLIKVGACGLNNTDVNTRTAWYSKTVTGPTTGTESQTANDDDATWGGSPITFPRIQGGDVCGIVEAVGKNVSTQLIGKRVLVDPCLRNTTNPDNINQYRYLGSEVNGGFAEYAVIDEKQVHPINSAYRDEELATLPIAYLTAENMLNRAQVGAEDTVLITGASGGVGSALVQLAKRRGARTIAMCSPEKSDALSSLSPTAVISRNPENLSDTLQQAIGTRQVSVVADIVGGALFSSLIDVLTRGGRYTCSGAIAGPIVDLDLRTMYLRDLTFTGATFSPIGIFADIVSYVEREEIRPLLAASYPLEQFHEAQKMFIAKKFFGNIVVHP